MNQILQSLLYGFLFFFVMALFIGIFILVKIYFFNKLYVQFFCKKEVSQVLAIIKAYADDKEEQVQKIIEYGIVDKDIVRRAYDLYYSEKNKKDFLKKEEENKILQGGYVDGNKASNEERGDSFVKGFGRTGTYGEAPADQERQGQIIEEKGFVLGRGGDGGGLGSGGGSRGGSGSGGSGFFGGSERSEKASIEEAPDYGERTQLKAFNTGGNFAETSADKPINKRVKRQWDV